MAVTPVEQDGSQELELLERARGMVDPVLRAAVGALPPAMRRICGYHLGWWDREGVAEQGSGGKAIRPALVLAAARAARGQGAQAARAGAAVELVHNFTLLHDDVIDNDLMRRHRPTAWSAFGVPDAIMAGDAMQALATRLLAQDPHPAAAAASARLSACVIEVCEGQHADCAFEGRDDVGLAECLAMAEAKTGALLGCACALGALYAGAPEPVVETLDAFGRQLGLGFQLIDDLLGIWGDPSVTGKPVGADLAAAKKSLPVVAALTSGTAPGNELAALYTGGPILEHDLPHAVELLEHAGARIWAQNQATSRISQALDHLAHAFPDPGSVDELLALAELVTRRDS